jgi:hypothetical protein
MPARMLAGFLMTILLSSCVSRAPRLEWYSQPYLGDNSTESIVRRGTEGNTESISCSSEQFQGRLCYSIDEILDLKKAEMNLIDKCEEWGE